MELYIIFDETYKRGFMKLEITIFRIPLVFLFYFSPPHSRGHAFSFYRTLLTLLTLLTLQTVFSQWVQQSLPVNKPITGLEFVDTLHGWVCTSRGNPPDTGYILYTTNSGTNWLTQFNAYNIAFTDLDMINSLTGYVSAIDYNISLDKIFYTNNGGTNWNSITMVPNMDIRDIQFLNKDSAWECGPSLGPDVRTTTDGGNTWVVRINGITQPTQKVFFLNYNTGFCGASGILFKTTNTGNSWTLLHVYSQDILAIYFLNENTGWLGMTNYQIQFTSNGGINWVSQGNPQYLTGITALYFYNLTTGWAGGSGGFYWYIYKTINGGQLWGYQIDSAGSNRISIFDTNNGWSGNTRIARTTNGGGPIYYLGIININNQIPNAYKLYQNYPNPFNSQTVIRFSLIKSSFAKLLIYDVLGKEMILWQSDEILPAGTHELKLDAKDLSSGVYFYKLIVTSKERNTVFSETKKLILIK